MSVNSILYLKQTYEEGDVQGTIAELMTEQIEFSNVVVLNKKDLVSKEQLQDVMDRLSLLNPKAKVVKCRQSKINVMEILNTRRFDRADMEENSVMIAATKVDTPKEVVSVPECCTTSLENGKKKCCKSKAENGQLVDSGKSQLLLGVVPNNNVRQLTRHETRFGISSFLYRARRPFHPGRLKDMILDKYFMEHYDEEGPVLRSHLPKLQKEAASKQDTRVKFMGELLRSKGFVWIATSNTVMGGWQQAGNILRLEGEGPWMCEVRDMWEGTLPEKLVRKDLTQANGKEYPYGDRRQELVFIGIKLKHSVIQKALDDCLLTDDEMSLGPEKWEEAWFDEDKIQMRLEEEEVDDDEDEEGSEGDDENVEKEGAEEKESPEDIEGPPNKRPKK